MALKPWIQTITRGRYSDVLVDVETLTVRVAGDSRKWREVGLLSHGTAEQICLLLRVAMTRHLTKKGEICPLILDDVTVHCDEDRRHQVLTLLHEISKVQQIVLFSKEAGVLDWAKTQLSGDRDRITELDASGVPA